MPLLIQLVLGFVAGLLLGLHGLPVLLFTFPSIFIIGILFRKERSVLPILLAVAIGLLRVVWIGPEVYLFTFLAGLPFFAFIRASLNNLYVAHLGKEIGGLVASLVFGVKSAGLDPGLQEAFRIAGVMHLLVASGAQVGILSGVLLRLADRFSFSPRMTFGLALASLLIYGGVAGASPPILRATVMSLILLGGKLFGREGDPLIALFAAVLFFLLIDPFLIGDIGFQLTFAATFSLIVLEPILEAVLAPRWGELLAMALSLTLSPLIFTLPLTAYHFQEISVVAFLTNFLVLPFIQVFTLLLFGATPILLILPILSPLISPVLTISVSLFSSIVQGCAHIPGAHIFISRPSIVFLAAWYGGIWFAIRWQRGWRLPFQERRAIVVLGSLLVGGAILWYFAFPSVLAGTPGKLSVVFLDVGQGDSIFVASPTGETMLIDGGPGREKKFQALQWLRAHGIHSLNHLVLTHPHADHLGGLLPVLQELEVHDVWDSGQNYPTPSYSRYLLLAHQKAERFHTVSGGEIFYLGSAVTLEVVYPTPPLLEGTRSDPNNNSIVIRMRYHQNAFLFVGDLEKEGEERVVSRGFDIQSDVLKVGHHGSRYSSTLLFLSRVSPTIAVISCGVGNRFGHPHAETLDRLQNFGVKIFRTDQDGEVRVDSDGAGMEVTNSH